MELGGRWRLSVCDREKDSVIEATNLVPVNLLSEPTWLLFDDF